jgi:SpoVK/Ycf46/Vps4 family AAA+-type ATPase
MLRAQIKSVFEGRVAACRLVTHDEPDVLEMVRDVAGALKLEPWVWSATRGIRRGVEGKVIPETMHPAAALHCMLTQATEPSMFVLLDSADHLEDKVVLRALKELVEELREQVSVSRQGPEAQRVSRLIMIDHRESVPDSIDAITTRVMIPLPEDDQIEAIVRRVVQKENRHKPVSVDMTKRDLAAVVQNLRGLTRRQIEQAVLEVISDDRAFTAEDVPRLQSAKRKLLRSQGVLEFVDAPTSLDDIGGLNALKKWLEQRRELFVGGEAASDGIDAPKGVLLLGVQGSGKSLAAKAIATAWKRPLMRLDPGALFDRYVGESERRLREALRQAEAMSPVVLWIDEIEKGLASAASMSTDGGLSRRMFGTMLTWMQEHTDPVFVVATANDIEALPPELLRKGRFDEIFFVDLPGDEARGLIFGIHLRKRKVDPTTVDLAQLVQESVGFSGAEIEQAIIAALTTCRAEKRGVDTQAIAEVLRTSPPLSVTMAEKVQALREWSRGRCVPAG